MDEHQQLLHRLAQDGESKIVLLVIDGVGDLRCASQPRSALDSAATPHLDELAARSSLGRLVPVAPGVTPGSGPGHLSLFGYDPTRPEADIGRGVLEALGIRLQVASQDLAARGNFATADGQGLLTDRRAGRPTTAECQRLCGLLNAALDGADLGGLEVEVHAGEGHRFVLLLRGEGLHPALADTDPQRLGVPPLAVAALIQAAEATAQTLRRLVARLEAALAGEPHANRVLLRGFSQLPSLPSMHQLYRLRCGAFAGYPLYRGVAAACGMEVVPCGKRIGEIVGTVAQRWQDFDFFFLHVKQTDQAGEDGDVAAKARVLEEVDAALPRLLDLSPEVIAVTGDHSTPAPMAAHSWHPVPLLIHARHCFVDEARTFDEAAAIRGALGTVRSRELVGLLLAHADRLRKFGA